MKMKCCVFMLQRQILDGVLAARARNVLRRCLFSSLNQHRPKLTPNKHCILNGRQNLSTETKVCDDSIKPGYHPRPLEEFISKEIRRFDPSISVEQAKTPPASWYHWPEFDRLDRETVFTNNWIAVERWDALQKPGDFVTGTVGDEPYIISRDEAGQLRAFYNVCRHHATLVEERACGKTECFVCPYHGWTYGLDGRLVKATKLRGIKDFKAKDFGLRPMEVCEWGTMIFIRATSAPPDDLHDRLRHLADSIETFGNPRDMVHVERREYEINCNWKITRDMIYHKNKLTPYLDKEYYGVVHKTMVRGEVVFDNGKFIEDPQGKLLLTNK